MCRYLYNQLDRYFNFFLSIITTQIILLVHTNHVIIKCKGKTNCDIATIEAIRYGSNDLFRILYNIYNHTSEK